MATAIQKKDFIPTINNKSMVKVATHKGKKSLHPEVSLAPLKRAKFALDCPDKAFAYSDRFAKIMDEASRWADIRDYDYSR